MREGDHESYDVTAQSGPANGYAARLDIVESEAARSREYLAELGPVDALKERLKRLDDAREAGERRVSVYRWLERLGWMVAGAALTAAVHELRTTRTPAPAPTGYQAPAPLYGPVTAPHSPVAMGDRMMEAIDRLSPDRTDLSDWTRDGRPRLDALEREMGLRRGALTGWGPHRDLAWRLWQERAAEGR